MVELTVSNGALLCNGQPCQNNEYRYYKASSDGNIKNRIHPTTSVCSSVLIYDDDLCAEKYVINNRTYFRVFDGKRHLPKEKHKQGGSLFASVDRVDDGKYIAYSVASGGAKWCIIGKTENDSWLCSPERNYKKMDRCGGCVRVEKSSGCYFLKKFDVLLTEKYSHADIYDSIEYDEKMDVFVATKGGFKYFCRKDNEGFYPTYGTSTFTQFEFYERVYVGIKSKANCLIYEIGNYKNDKIDLPNQPIENNGVLQVLYDDNTYEFNTNQDNWEDILSSYEGKNTGCSCIFITSGEHPWRQTGSKYIYQRDKKCQFDKVILIDTNIMKMCYCQRSTGKNEKLYEIKIVSSLDENYDILRFSRVFKKKQYVVEPFEPIKNEMLNYNDIVHSLKKDVCEYKMVIQQNKLVIDILAFYEQYRSFGISEDAMLSNILSLFDLETKDDNSQKSKLEILKEELTDGITDSTEILSVSAESKQLSEYIDDFAKDLLLNDAEKKFFKDCITFEYRYQSENTKREDIIQVLKRLNPRGVERQECQKSIVNKYNAYCKNKKINQKRKSDDLRKVQAEKFIAFLKELKEKHKESFEY